MVETIKVLNDWLVKYGNGTKMFIYNHKDAGKVIDKSFFIKIVNMEQDSLLHSVDQIKKVILDISLNLDIETLIEQISSYDPIYFLDSINKEFNELKILYNNNFYYSYFSLLDSKKSIPDRERTLQVLVSIDISENLIYSPNYNWTIFERLINLFNQQYS